MPLNCTKPIFPIAIAFLFILLIQTVLYAQDGTIDAGFGTNGKVFIPTIPATGPQPLSMALQPDGKIIQYAQAYNGGTYPDDHVDLLLSRVNPDGTLDVTFGSGGKVHIPVGQSEATSSSRGLALQADGKILVAAHHYNTEEFYFEVIVLRLNADGSMDNSFGVAGKVIINHGLYNDFAQSIAVQPDGKILVGGSFTNNGTYHQYMVVRLLPNGSFDLSFDGDGIKGFSFSNSNEIIKVIKLQEDGKILVAGNSWYFNYDFMIARLNPDGSFDNTFDSDGYTLFPIGPSDDSPYDLEIQQDGKILIGGQSHFPPNMFFSLVRLNTNGSFDNTFSDDGKLTFNFGSSNNHGYAVEIQKDGKILMAGTSYQGPVLNAAIARLNPNGTFDNSFDSDGKVLMNVTNTDWSLLPDIVLQDNGKILGLSNYTFGLSLFRLNNSSATGSLPVNLNGFSASLLQGQVNLSWETSHEVNNKGFYIQRATEGTDGSLTWKDIGFIDGANNYGVHKYNFEDKQPADGTNYYRLKQVDYDERTKYSITKLIKLTKNRLQFRLSPNPVSSGPVAISLFSNFSGPARLVVTDITGSVRLSKSVVVKNGRLTSAVDLTGFSQGVYTIALSSGNQQWTERFILSK